MKVQMKKLLVLATVTAAFCFVGIGCKHHDDHPHGDHPKSDHPKSDHPTDHPKSDHPSQ